MKKNYCIFPSDSQGLDFFQLYSNLFINLTLNVTPKIEKPYPFGFIENNAFDPSFERQGNIPQAETEHGAVNCIH